MSRLQEIRRELGDDPVLAEAFRTAAWTGPPPRAVRRRLVVAGAGLLTVGLLAAGQGERPCPAPASGGRTHPVACPAVPGTP